MTVNRHLITALTLALAGVLPWTVASHDRHDHSSSPGGAVDAVAASSSRGGSIWGADYFPNVELTTHRGEKVRFFDDLISGKVVAINFIYTHCTDACPLETARMREVYELLGDRMGSDVFFYSITIDPERDTPEVLGRFARRWQTGPGWTFLTGSDSDITLLRRKLGVYVEEIQDAETLDHNLSLVIGNQATGRWMKRSPFENAHVLATQIGGWLHNWRRASAERRDYADSPALRPISDGEKLFRTRCASCHTIGAGDRTDFDRLRIGPDLYQVSLRRDREWLARWIAEPDRMIAEGDPLALALLAEYDNLPMPNLRLSTVDVEAVLDYLDKESARQEQAQRAAQETPAPTLN